MVGWEVEPAEPWRGQGAPWPPIIVAVLVGLLIVAGGVQLVKLGGQVTRLRDRVTLLEHACGPVDTGGGVTQCAQPNVLQAPAR